MRCDTDGDHSEVKPNWAQLAGQESPGGLAQWEDGLEKRVLLVDHDQDFGSVLGNVLGEGYLVRHVKDPGAAVSITGQDEADVILLNWDPPGAAESKSSLRELLQTIGEAELAPPVIVYSWDARRETALEAVRLGALDFFLQPLSILELKFAIRRAYRRMALTRELAATKKLLVAGRVDGLLGNSKPMEQVREVIRKVANVSTTVLITGESGTGKEVVARSIHALSQRSEKPFVAFSACALPETLIDDELFGHGKGAFTGASQSRRGRFEEAQGGTIFLDEIADLALPLQAKLLRVLQERSMERLGSNISIPLDVRVICATNRDIERMVKEGTFRQDLYFRISVVRIALPPLRERVDDIPLLAEHFMRMFASTHQKDVRGLTTGFVSALTSYDWPGNVRELQNVIERSLVLAEGTCLRLEDLPVELKGLAIDAEVPRGSFQEAVRTFKREIVRSALRLHAGNKLKAAQELQISRCYLHRLINQLKIEDEPDDGKQESVLAEDEVVTTQVQ